MPGPCDLAEKVNVGLYFGEEERDGEGSLVLCRRFSFGDGKRGENGEV